MVAAADPGQLGNWDIDWWLLDDDERRKLEDALAVAGAQLGLPEPPTVKQLQVHLAPERGADQPILLGGGMGGGKSATLCAAGIRVCRKVVNNRALLLRREFNAFRTSTLQELERLLPMCPDAVHQPGRFRVFFPETGSYLYYMGAGRPHERHRLLSSQWGWLGIDELPELDQDIWNILGTRLRWGPAARAGMLQILATANPEPGWVKEQFVANPKEGYRFIPALAQDNPHLNGGDPWGYIETQRRRLPEPMFKAFIEGDWNAFAPADAAIPEHLLSAAFRHAQPAGPECVWGIDIGYLGTDRTELVRRRGGVFDHIAGWVRLDTVDSVAAIRQQWAVADPKPDRMIVDSDGVGGGVGDQLRRLSDEGELGSTTVIPLSAMAAASDKEHYYNCKAEHFFIHRHRLEGGQAYYAFASPDAERIVADLATPRYQVSGKRIMIEPKDIVRKRLGRSPDLGDACLLTEYTGHLDYVPYTTAGERAAAAALIANPDDAAAVIDLVAERARRRQEARYHAFSDLVPYTGDDYDDDLGY